MGTHVQADGLRKMSQNAAKSPFRGHQKAHRNNVQISLCEQRREKPKVDLRKRVHLHVEKHQKFIQKPL